MFTPEWNTDSNEPNRHGNGKRFSSKLTRTPKQTMMHRKSASRGAINKFAYKLDFPHGMMMHEVFPLFQWWWFTLCLGVFSVSRWWRRLIARESFFASLAFLMGVAIAIIASTGVGWANPPAQCLLWDRARRTSVDDSQQQRLAKVWLDAGDPLWYENRSTRLSSHRANDAMNIWAVC